MSDNRLEEQLKENGLSVDEFFNSCYWAAVGCLKVKVDRLAESLERPAGDGAFSEHVAHVQAIKNLSKLLETLTYLFAEAEGIATYTPF